jgi:hypothetical protein
MEGYVRRRFLLLSALLALAIGQTSLAVQCAGAADPWSANPEDGTLVDGVCTNPYFMLRYPSPPGWKPGPQPAPPSYTGYYVLSTPAPAEDMKATILIAAQDAFFAGKSVDDAMGMAKNLAHNVSETDRAALQPSIATIAGNSFVRLELKDSLFSRIVLVTDIRCHVLIFTFTAAEPETLENLAQSLDHVSLESDAPASSPTGASFPACVKGYAAAENILSKVDPVLVGPRFLTVPVRIIIGTDGRIKHTHVICAFPEQQKSIEDAMAQWAFKPYLVDGKRSPSVGSSTAPAVGPRRSPSRSGCCCSPLS